MQDFVNLLVVAFGLIASGLTIWDAYVKRRDKLYPPEILSPPDPAQARSDEHEDRVLIRFDDGKRNEPGTFEHYVHGLMAPLRPGYKEAFVLSPSATLWVARTTIGFCRIAVGYASLALLIVLLLPLFSGTVDTQPIKYAATLAFVLAVCIIGARPLWRISQNAQAAIRAATAYREYIAAEKIRIDREFTQAKSRFIERHPKNDASA